MSKEEASKYAEEEKLEYMETSSKTGENIHKAVKLLCQKVLQNTELERDFSFTLEQSMIGQFNLLKLFSLIIFSIFSS